MNYSNLKRVLSGVFAVAGLMQIGAQATGGQTTLVRLQLTNYLAQMKQIQKLEFDLAGVNLKQKTVDLVVSSEDLNRLRKEGFKPLFVKNSAALLSPDTQYQSPEKILGVLKAYEAAYPTLATVMTVGKSLEGREIYAIKITSDAKANDPAKPRIFFNGMHHAREVMSVEVPLDTINVLLTQYGKDPKVTHWVDANEIWVMPMFNVDGNNKVWTQSSMWRKNTRNGYGVDLNRNYPYGWGSCNGSSGVTFAQNYRGPSAASEPETQVMMNFVSKIRPVFSISYHSFSELVIYPYGCGDHVPTKEVLEKIGNDMAKKIVGDDGHDQYKAGTAPELLYSADGGDIDWMYHEYQVNAYVIEVNSSDQGFQPSYSRWREDTVKRVRPAWQYLLEQMDGPALAGKIVGAAKPVQNASLHIENVGGVKFVQDFSVQASGYFHVLVPRGNYRVTIKAPGVSPQVKNVVVGSTKTKMLVEL
jgi:carboxypeptidase T